jgi:hypothetical protein
MSACPSFTFSCDNNNWNCCGGGAKDPGHNGDGYSPKQQPAPQHPPPMQPPPRVVASPLLTRPAPGYAPSDVVHAPHQVSPAPKPPATTPHQVSPALKPPVTTPHALVPPCRSKAHEPPPATIPAWTVPPRALVLTNELREPPAMEIPAVVPPKRYEAPQPIWTAVAPRAPMPPYEAPEPPPGATMPTYAAVTSTRYEPRQPACPITPRAIVKPNEPPVRPPPARMASNKHDTPSRPSARTTGPPRVSSKTTYDDGVLPAVSTKRPDPVPHRIYYEVTAPATSATPVARASQYPPAHHPQHDDTTFCV